MLRYIQPKQAGDFEKKMKWMVGSCEVHGCNKELFLMVNVEALMLCDKHVSKSSDTIAEFDRRIYSVFRLKPLCLLLKIISINAYSMHWMQAC